MANIIRRRPQTMEEWEPLRALRELMGWDPFREMAPTGRQSEMGFVPQFDVKETGDGYLFKADLPGVKEEDIELSLTGNRLTISGKREHEEEKGEEGSRWYAYERSYGSFTRSFTLPEGIDPEQCKAELKNGELSVLVPKKPEVQPRRIHLGGREEKGKAKA